MKPLVSEDVAVIRALRSELAVGLVAYEEPRRIVSAINALLYQQRVQIRIRIFDDSRTDDVASAVLPLCQQYPQLDYRRNPERLGLALNCHQAMRWAAEHGDFCAIGSDHDEVLPGWAYELICALRSVPSAVLAAPLVRRLNSDGRDVEVPTSSAQILHRSGLVRAIRAVNLPRVGDLVYGIGRRELYQRIPFHPTMTPDRLLIIQSMSLGGLVNVPRVLYHRVDQERRIQSSDLAVRQREAMLLPDDGGNHWWVRNAGLILAGGFSRPSITGPLFAVVAATAYLHRYIRRFALRSQRRRIRLLRRGAVAALSGTFRGAGR